MKIRYVIEDLLCKGYYSSSHHSFKGIIFASHYMSEDDAKVTIHQLPDGTYGIVKIYIKE